MNALKLTVLNNIPHGSRLFVNGAEIALKRAKSGVKEAVVYAENGEYDIIVKNFLWAGLPFFKWFLFTLFFWLVSVFGIFDVHGDGSCYAVNARLKAKSDGDASLTLKFGLFKDGAPVFTVVQSDAETEEISNVYALDKRAKRRNRIYGIVRILSAIAVAAALAALIFGRN
ncbi:MAG TPA: hypothetical protein DDW54_01430 [Clostridiales bacterium]|nr:hypothetical protein [Clostridiales bacterium]